MDGPIWRYSLLEFPDQLCAHVIVQGLRMFPALIIVPSLQICWTLFSILSGMLYFQEYEGMKPGPTAMFVIGVVVSDSWLGGLERSQRWCACAVQYYCTAAAHLTFSCPRRQFAVPWPPVALLSSKHVPCMRCCTCRWCLQASFC